MVLQETELAYLPMSTTACRLSPFRVSAAMAMHCAPI